MTKQNVFIIGSKGVPGNYGGYETFVDKLTEYHKKNNKIKYHVACKGSVDKICEYNNARCFYVKVPDIGAAQAIYYDVRALCACIKYIKDNNISNPVIYILACRIGVFLGHFSKIVYKLNGKIYVNPDGHEWKRSKWSYPVKKYWKISERFMVKHSDMLICDSINIEDYIKKEYKKYNPCTTYISYGAEIYDSTKYETDVSIKKYREWLNKHHLIKKDYYLIVGRFVPENNYETMIKEFMECSTKKKLVIICNENQKLQQHLKNKLNYMNDKRIMFVGTVYDKALLMVIRKYAFAYIHGHEVGGTNPSLLEALGSTDLNLLLDVDFNKEVAGNSAIYWNKKNGCLKNMLEQSEKMSDEEVDAFGAKAKDRIINTYSWKKITCQYEQLFLQGE